MCIRDSFLIESSTNGIKISYEDSVGLEVIYHHFLKESQAFALIEYLFFNKDVSNEYICLSLIHILLDFKSAFWVTLIRSVLKLALNNKGLETLIGLPINIIGVLVFVLAFAWIWNKERTHGRFVLATIVGTISLSITMVLVNYVYAIPLYCLLYTSESQTFSLYLRQEWCKV